MKKSHRILQLQFYKGTHTYSPILHAEDRELFEYYYYIKKAKRPSVQKRYSTHRRQGDLLEIHLCILQDLPKAFQAFQPQDLPKAFQTFMTFQPIQAILQVPVSPGNPPHSSILQLECIFYKQFQFDWFPQKLHRVPVGQYKLQTLHSSKKGRCCDIGQIDIFSRIELLVKVTSE